LTLRSKVKVTRSSLQYDFFFRFFCFFFFRFFSEKLFRTITFLSFEIGQWYLVCECMTIRWCVVYRNDLRWTSRSNNCFLNNIFLSGPSFGSFGQAVSEEKIFKNRPIRNKNCLWWPCLLMDRDKMSNLYRGPSIDASSINQLINRFWNEDIENKIIITYSS
jgi:hypothetical protein